MDGETKTFTDALRKATYHLGSIMPIMDSILIWNNRLNSEPENRSGTSPEALIAEVDSTEIREEDRKVVRSIQTKLSTQFSRDRAELETKNQTLQDEYRGFLDSWDLHRQRLDRLEAVRNRKQNLLGGEDGNGRNRRGAISLGDAARSDLELDQIMASLVNEDLTNPDILARRNVAVIPDMLSVTDPRALECQYDDLNGLVSDPVAYADSVHHAGEWTPAEREIFIRAYMATPKQFGRISEQLPHKSSEQCVLFYYLNKKEINFKGLLSKQGGGRGRRRGRRAGKQKGNALLTDLRQPHADDEDLSINDSSPAPGTPVSDSEAGPSRPRLSLRESTRTATKRRASRAASYDPDSGSDEDGQRSPSSNGRDKNGGDYEDNETRESSDAPHKSRKRLKAEDSSTAKDAVSRPRPRGGKGPSGKGSTTHWTLSDKAVFMRLLPIHGKNWAVIAEDLPDKTPVQVRNYFQNHSVELGLPAIAARAEKPPRGAGNPNKVRFFVK
jgi:Myb-like DNA-binding domain